MFELVRRTGRCQNEAVYVCVFFVFRIKKENFTVHAHQVEQQEVMSSDTSNYSFEFQLDPVTRMRVVVCSQPCVETRLEFCPTLTLSLCSKLHCGQQTIQLSTKGLR